MKVQNQSLSKGLKFHMTKGTTFLCNDRCDNMLRALRKQRQKKAVCSNISNYQYDSFVKIVLVLCFPMRYLIEYIDILWKHDESLYKS